MRNVVCTVLLWIAGGIIAFAANDPRLEKAEQAYKSGDYYNAIDQYESLFKAGHYSASLFYNAGNAHFRAGQLGQAILYYERAAQLRPSDPDIRHNLQVANSRIVEPVDALPSFFLLRWWRGLAGLFLPDTWALLGLILLCTSAAGGISWQWGKSRPQRKWGFIVGVVAAVLCLLPFSLAAYRAALLKNSGYAIVVKRTLPLLRAPESASEITTLHEGTKVQLLDNINQWQKVELPNGEVGWLEKRGIIEI